MAQQHDDETFHPGTGEYIQIGVILAVLTAIEVALYFFDVSTFISTPVLLALTTMKFLLVVFWFMHLRFDTPLFRRLFFTGVALAFAVFTAVIAIFTFGPS
jgi:cytochrome c oxidase subunit 4